MLKLTLYKDVILNETYQNVFSLGITEVGGKSILEKYLDNKSKAIIQLDNVYYENTGQIVLDYDLVDEMLSVSEIYDFNYMKCELYDANESIILKRYCFINSIIIKNGCVYLTYSEDIWSSYSNKIHGIKDSLLVATRVRSYQNFTPEILRIPVKYDGNNQLSIRELVENVSKKYYCIFELQSYVLTSGSENPRDGFVKQCILAEATALNNNFYVNNYLYSYNDIVDKINVIGRNIANGFISPNYRTQSGQLELFTRYEIGNIYIIPASYAVNLVQNATAYGIFSTNDGLLSHLKATFTDIENIENFEYGKSITLYSGSLQDDYKDKEIGTFSSLIDLIHNGTNHEISLTLMASKTEISLFLNTDNQIKDITDNFNYELSFDMINSSALAQRKIAYQQKKLANTFGIISNFSRMFDAGFNIKTGYDKLAKGFTEDIDRYKFGGFEQMWNGAYSGITGITNIAYYSLMKETLNAAIYSNYKTVFNSFNNVRNCVYGIIITSIIPDNSEYVKDAINVLGYETYKIINDFSKLMITSPNYFTEVINCNYNIIKFEIINVYGSFPRDIANVLNGIFTSGVKIWFKETMEEDNYVI